MSVAAGPNSDSEGLDDRHNRVRLIFVIILTATFLDSIDFAIVQVALPTIAIRFATSFADTQWVIGAYGITLAGMLLLSGRAGDLYGQKKIFVVGMALFTVASLAGGLAPSLLSLVAFRLMQGIGAAMTTVTALAIFIGLFRDEKERIKYYGIYVASFSAGTAVGVVAGGVLTVVLGWRSVLLINVPIGTIVFLLAQKYLPKGEGRSVRKSLDMPGAITITSGLILLVYALTNAANEGLESTPSILSLGASLLVLALFVFIESRSKEPLLPLDFLRRRSTLAVNVVCLFVAMTAGVMVLLTYYFQEVLGWSAFYSGIGILPIPAMFTFGGVWGASWVQRKLGLRRVLILSMTMLTAGAAYLTEISATGNYWTVAVPGMTVFSLGASLGFPAIFAEASAAAGRGEEGLASGVINTTFRVGVPVGLAILLAVLGATDQASSGQTVARSAAVGLTTGLQFAFLAAVFLLLMGLAVASRIRDEYIKERAGEGLN